MKTRLETRWYTNLMLTLIAALLLASAVRQYRIGITSAAWAQDAYTRDGSSAVKINTSIPQTQDVAVAAATQEVASANRDIASAIRELAKSVEGLGATIEKLKPAASAGATNASSGYIEVGPSTTGK